MACCSSGTRHIYYQARMALIQLVWLCRWWRKGVGDEFACGFRKVYLKFKARKPEGQFLICRWAISLWSHCFNWQGAIVEQGCSSSVWQGWDLVRSFVVNHGHIVPEDSEPLSLCLSLPLSPIPSPLSCPWFCLFFGGLFLSFCHKKKLNVWHSCKPIQTSVTPFFPSGFREVLSPLLHSREMTNGRQSEAHSQWALLICFTHFLSLAHTRGSHQRWHLLLFFFSINL